MTLPEMDELLLQLELPARIRTAFAENKVAFDPKRSGLTETSSEWYLTRHRSHMKLFVKIYSKLSSFYSYYA